MAEQLRLTATAMASDGRAVSRHPSGQVVFLEGALPGEEVVATIVAERRHYLTARVARVVTASAARLEPRCGHVAEGCGGCQWLHVGIDAQVEFKRQILIDTIRRIGRIECPELSETVGLEPWNFRTSLRATVVDGRAALRRARSNEGIPVPGCLVVHPLLTELLDGRRYPGAEEVLLRCGARTGERLVSVRPHRIVADVPGDVRSDWVHELAAGRTWRVSAASFFQSRPDGVDALADLVVSAASDVEPTVAVDLYSGVGVFAGVLAARGWSVTAVEGSATAVRDAEANLAGLGVRVVRADVTRWYPEQAALVVADPSRAGLGSFAELVASLTPEEWATPTELHRLGRPHDGPARPRVRRSTGIGQRVRPSVTTRDAAQQGNRLAPLGRRPQRAADPRTRPPVQR